MTQLNKEQQAAAEFVNGIASVVAVPGSGKTLTMTHRIGNLVKKGVSPENILGLTFTRNAAQAMRDKLQTVLEGAASRVHLSTIHSFCMTLLKNEGTTFQILQGSEQMVFVRKIMRKMKINNLPTGMILREISLAKSNLITVDEFEALYEGDQAMLKVANVFRVYEEEKKKRLFMDFDDLLFETYQLLKNDSDVRQKYQESFRHVTVDEFRTPRPYRWKSCNCWSVNRSITTRYGYVRTIGNLSTPLQGLLWGTSSISRTCFRTRHSSF